MLVNVVARGSLASSAAETPTGGTTCCALAAAFPGDWLDPPNVMASTAAPAATRTTPAATICRTWPTQNCRTAGTPSPARARRPRLMCRRLRLMRGTQPRIQPPPMGSRRFSPSLEGCPSPA
jgi:hypothetical protein